MVMMMWWSNLLNSAFVQSIIKAVLGALVLFGLVKSIRKDAAKMRLMIKRMKLN